VAFARAINSDIAIVAEAMILIMWPWFLVFRMRRDHRLDDRAYWQFSITQGIGFALFLVLGSLVEVAFSLKAAMFWLPLLLVPSYLPAAPRAISETLRRYRWSSLSAGMLGALAGLSISHTSIGPALVMGAFALTAHTILVARFIVGSTPA
jgi:hypothetical protein